MRDTNIGCLLFTNCQFFACACVCLCRRVSMCYAAPWLASKSRFWQIIHRRGGWQAKWGLSERLTKAQGGKIFEKKAEKKLAQEVRVFMGPFWSI